MWGENPARVTHLPRGSPRRAGTARRAQAPVSPHSSGAGCRTPSPWGDLAQGPAPEASCCVLSVCASIHTPLETGVVVWVSGWPGCLATTPRPHLAQLPRLMVGTRHTAGVSGQACRAGTGAQYLVDVVQAGAFIRPVGVALLDAVLRQRGQHDDHHAALLPHHLHRESGRAARTC